MVTEWSFKSRMVFRFMPEIDNTMYALMADTHPSVVEMSPSHLAKSAKIPARLPTSCVSPEMIFPASSNKSLSVSPEQYTH